MIVKKLKSVCVVPLLKALIEVHTSYYSRGFIRERDTN